MKYASWIFPHLANIFNSIKKRDVLGAGIGLAEPFQVCSEERGSEPTDFGYLVRQPRRGAVGHLSLMPLNVRFSWLRLGGERLLLGRGCAGLVSERMLVPSAHWIVSKGPLGLPQPCVLTITANVFEACTVCQCFAWVSSWYLHQELALLDPGLLVWTSEWPASWDLVTQWWLRGPRDASMNVSGQDHNPFHLYLF